HAWRRAWPDSRPPRPEGTGCGTPDPRPAPPEPERAYHCRGGERLRGPACPPRRADRNREGVGRDRRSRSQGGRQRLRSPESPYAGPSPESGRGRVQGQDRVPQSGVSSEVPRAFCRLNSAARLTISSARPVWQDIAFTFLRLSFAFGTPAASKVQIGKPR